MPIGDIPTYGTSPKINMQYENKVNSILKLIKCTLKMWQFGAFKDLKKNSHKELWTEW